ncbi:HemK methyltransferase 2 [Carabus blaptoides fortunei]
METPNFDHLSKFPSVYAPSEDTFLFLDALEQEIPFIQSLQPNIIAEIGSGSGVNIVALTKALGDISAAQLAVDINSAACEATKLTAEVNNVTIDVFNMNLLDSFRQNLFDIILFNPPYVVTESEEIFGNGIERSWAGGEHGREIMDKLFPKLPTLLSENGVFYLVAIKENNPEEIMDIMTREYNFISTIIKERRILGEHLYILKFQKSCIKSKCS